MIPTAVVTGATSGLGRWIARGLGDAGHEVVLVGRDADRLAATASWIAATASTPPHTIRADLSLLSETRDAARQILDRWASLDLLVANAGTLSPRRTVTAEGHELTLAVNHLSPFVLTRMLMPALAAPILATSAAGRAVLTGSSSSDRAGINPDDLELARPRAWRMTRAYARSKLALLMTTTELARQERARGTGVTLNVVHPGLVATDLVRSGGIDQFVWTHILSRFARSDREGARTPLFAALSPDLEGVSGAYLKDCRVVPGNRLVRDPALRARVLAATEALVA